MEAFKCFFQAFKKSGTLPLAQGQGLMYYYEGAINGDLTNTADVVATPTDDNGIPMTDDKLGITEEDMTLLRYQMHLEIAVQ